MHLDGTSVLVTGGASGLGLATAKRFAAAGAELTILDLETSAGAQVAEEQGWSFSPGDVRDTDGVNAALDVAEGKGPIRAVIHCAGTGGPIRIVDKEGNPGSLEHYQRIIDINLVGSFNVLRLGATRMVRNEPLDGDRGVVVMTASVAAFEGQIGQIPYSASKAGIVGMTIVAARDLASRFIRVCTIAPGTFDTPILQRVSPEAREGLAKAVPHPARLGRPEEFAMLACNIIENPMLNGETIRLDGAIRMPPR